MAVKGILRSLGLPSSLVRRVAIASYEAEMNAVIYAWRCRVKLLVDTRRVEMAFEDFGPGIDDIDLAMQEGYSTASREIRGMGFGAGMGLPNIKRNADGMDVKSEVRKGTTVRFVMLASEETRG